MAGGRSWTAAEDARLLGLAEAGRGADEIGAALRRSRDAVYCRLCTLRGRRAAPVPKLPTGARAHRCRPTETPAAPPPRRVTRERPCLCCEKPFRSTGPGHRLCDTCRKKSLGPYDL